MLFHVLANALNRRVPTRGCQRRVHQLGAAALCLILSVFCVSTLYALTPTQTFFTTGTDTIAKAGKPTKLVVGVEGPNGFAPGLVTFCDATAPRCEDSAILGTVPISPGGGVGQELADTAFLVRVFTPGTHTVYAIYSGSATYAPSKSAPITIQVTGKLPSTTTFSVSGGISNQTLTASVVGQGRPAITGEVSFLSPASGNQSEGSSSLGASTASHGFTPLAFTPATGGNLIKIADFNNDGLADVISVSAFPNDRNGTFNIQLADPSHQGSFLSPVTYNLPGNPLDVTVGDFNNDGVMDLAFLLSSVNLTGNDPGMVQVFLGNVAQPGQFQIGGTFAVGNINDNFTMQHNNNIATADFNHDGTLDLAIVNSANATVSILQGDPANRGSFLSQVTYPIGASTPASMVAADFNGDGWTDLAMSILVFDGTNYSSKVNLLLADPNNSGHLLPAVSYALNPSSAAIGTLVSGDLNGDGLPDLAIWNTDTINVLLSDSSHPGSFLPTQNYTPPSGAGNLALGDYNGDGTLDLAFPVPTGIGVMYGDPAHPGTLLSATTYAVTTPLNSILPTDFNGDGISDLIEWSVTPSSAIGVTLGSIFQTGTASITVSGNKSNAVDAIYSGDSNYAGEDSCVIDAASLGATAPINSAITVTNITATSATITWTSNISAIGQVAYGLTSSLGSTTPWVALPTTSHSFTLTNLSPASTYSYQVKSIAYSNGCNHWTTTSSVASFSTPLPSHAPTQTALKATSTSFTGQVFELTATVTSGSQNVTSGLVRFCDSAAKLCEGNAALGSAQLQSNGTAVLTRNFDPGSHSVYAIFGGTLAYSTSTSSGQDFTAQGGLLPSVGAVLKSGTGPQYTLTAAVNITGTHAPTGDISFIADASGAQLATTTLSGSKTTVAFGTPFINNGIPSYTYTNPLLGDLNNDGAEDIVAYVSTGNTGNGIVSLIKMPNSTRTFEQSGLYSTSGPPLDLVDLNGDGLLDIIAIGTTSTAGTGTASMEILYNLPSTPSNSSPGQFTVGPTYSLPAGSYAVAHGDFNGDGLPDVAVALTAESGNDQVDIFLNDPTNPGQLLAGNTYPATAPLGIASGDFNQDGLTDLAVVDTADGNVWIYLADSAHPGQFLPATTFPTDAHPESVVTGDFNQDGVLDLAIANASPTTVSILLGDPAHPGQFLPQTSYPASLGTAQNPLFVNDINADGVSDVIYQEGNSMTILAGDPAHKGQFLPATSQPISGAPSTFDSSATGVFSADGPPTFVFFTPSQITEVPTQDTISATTASIPLQVQGDNIYVHTQYTGDSLYKGSSSCSIDLSTTSVSAPTINGATVSNIGTNFATIQWTSNVPTIGNVQVSGPNLIEQTPWDSQVTTNHSFEVFGLSPGLTYTYKVASLSYFSGCNHWTTFSTPATFTTKATQ